MDSGQWTVDSGQWIDNFRTILLVNKSVKAISGNKCTLAINRRADCIRPYRLQVHS
jgi:hypothetical protein